MSPDQQMCTLYPVFFSTSIGNKKCVNIQETKLYLGKNGSNQYFFIKNNI